jgi:toxin ParE1/3/4
MSRQVEYHPEAKSEMRKAASWYDDKVDGLGLDFLFEVKNTESYIVQNPELCPLYEAGTKRYIMQRFPFAAIYLTSKEKIQIIAVAHCKRKPGYWKNRLEEREIERE